MSPLGQPVRAAGAKGPRSPRRSARRPVQARGVNPLHHGRGPATAPPQLRLVRPPEGPAGEAAASQAQPAPIMDAADPRWVLAVRTSQCLQGTILAPEQRDRLLILARLLGLTPFDANLIIAIVQDQARRGHASDYCAAAGRSQLAMIPLPTRARFRAALQRRRPLRTATLIAVFLGIELLAAAWWLWLR